MPRPRTEPAPAREYGLMVPVDSFSCELDGVHYSLSKDTTLVAEDHVLVRTHPHLFKKVRPHIPFEQATAAPGEVR